MYFDLTDTLVNSILGAMENQNSAFQVDSSIPAVVKADKTSEDFYPLPEWTSADGFALRQDFTDSLYNPLAKDELQQILHSGRGVFKSFKVCLKKYPEIERKWHLYKNSRMRIYVNEWYNSLRELWGLEKLVQEPEDFEDLVQNDFYFRQFNPDEDKETVLYHAKIAMELSEENLEEVSRTFYFLWKNQFESAADNLGLVAETFSKEFAGCIAYAKPSHTEKTVVLTAFFVEQNFRGLGVGKELLFQSLEILRKRNIQWVIISNVVIPETMIPLLERSGFKKIGSGYVLNLAA